MIKPITREERSTSEKIDVLLILINMFMLFISSSAIFLGYTAFSMVRYNMRQAGIKVYEFVIPPRGKIGGLIGIGVLAVFISYAISSIPAISSSLDVSGFSLSNSWLMSQKGFALNFPAYLSNIMIFWIFIYTINAIGETNFFNGVVPKILEKHMSKSTSVDESKSKHRAILVGSASLASVFHLSAYVPATKLINVTMISMNFLGAFIFFYLCMITVEKLNSTSETGFGHLLTNLKLWGLI